MPHYLIVGDSPSLVKFGVMLRRHPRTFRGRKSSYKVSLIASDPAQTGGELREFEVTIRMASRDRRPNAWRLHGTVSRSVLRQNPWLLQFCRHGRTEAAFEGVYEFGSHQGTFWFD